MTCGHEELFARFHGGAMNEAEKAEVRRIVGNCAVCRHRLDELVATDRARVAPSSEGPSFEQALETHATAVTPGPKPRSRAPWLVAAAIVVGIGLLVLFVTTRAPEGGGEPAPAASERPASVVPTAAPRTHGESRRWTDVKVEKAPYSPPRPQVRPVLIDDGAGETPAASGPTRRRETPFDRAMRPYARNDFGAAATALAPLARSGDARASFYLGVSLLLVDRNDDAIEALDRAAKSWRGGLGSQAHYYLGVAYLRTYRFEEALLELHAAQQTRGPYATKAAELEEEVRASAL